MSKLSTMKRTKTTCYYSRFNTFETLFGTAMLQFFSSASALFNQTLLAHETLLPGKKEEFKANFMFF
jgi:hypothetical protein